MKGFAALAVLGTLSASIQTQPAAPAAIATSDGFPEGAGKAVVLKVCSNCHGPDTVVQTLRTRQEWSDVVDQMARKVD